MKGEDRAAEVFRVRRQASNCGELAIGCEPSIGPSSVPTGNRPPKANDLYELPLTIQSATNLQSPERNSANVVVRAESRLGTLPLKDSGNDRKKKPEVPKRKHAVTT
jgi:hypothetical protein